MEVKAMYSPSLSVFDDERYVLVDAETGEVVDDAQGYGYKTKQKAHAAWAYKTRDKSKDKEKAAKYKEKAAKYKKIKQWLKHNKQFENLLEAYLFDICTGQDPDETFNADLVRKVLQECELEIDFLVRDLMTVLRREYS